MGKTMSLMEWCRRNGADMLLRHYRQGGNSLSEEQIGFSSGKRVTFRCHVCGLAWEGSLNNATGRKADQACPYCSRRRASPFYNLAVEYPELAAEWDHESNAFPPEACTPHSKKRVSWRCRNGHRWQAVICDRTEAAGAARASGRPLCPYCGGRKASVTRNLVTEYPEVAREWDYVRNAGEKPEDYPPYSGRTAWWVCGYDPAHHWRDRIGNRTILQRGCPICARRSKVSYPEWALLYYLRRVCPDCVSEAPLAKYRIDLLLPGMRVAIEHDGSYYHGGEASRKRDREKDEAIRKAGHQVLRIMECAELDAPVECGEDAIRYRLDYQQRYIDGMIAAVFQRLGLPPQDFDHRRDRQAINQLAFHERKKHTLAVEQPALAREWSPRNESGPDTVTSMSSRKVWRRCPACGQEYQATVSNRVRAHSGCPYCAGLRVYEGNCLATVRPDIAAQWHGELNGGLTPHDVLPGTERKVYWQCPNGHVWKASVYSRTCRRGSGCPVCSHRQVHEDSSLRTLYPALAALWHPEKNAPLTPDDVLAQSNRRVWWRCGKGHEWRAAVKSMWKLPADRLCPYCGDRVLCKDNSLLARYPALAADWDAQRNAPLTPDQVLCSSGRAYWWRRGESVWRESILERRLRGGDVPRKLDPRCNRWMQLAVTHPAIAAQWDYDRNAPLTPEMVSAGSGRRVWWRCERGHVWDAPVSKRKRGDGCPYCSGRRRAHMELTNPRNK